MDIVLTLVKYSFAKIKDFFLGLFRVDFSVFRQPGEENWRLTEAYH